MVQLLPRPLHLLHDVVVGLLPAEFVADGADRDHLQVSKCQNLFDSTVAQTECYCLHLTEAVTCLLLELTRSERLHVDHVDRQRRHPN